jgi:hypothetical protein
MKRYEKSLVAYRHATVKAAVPWWTLTRVRRHTPSSIGTTLLAYWSSAIISSVSSLASAKVRSSTIAFGGECIDIRSHHQISISTCAGRFKLTSISTSLLTHRCRLATERVRSSLLQSAEHMSMGTHTIWIEPPRITCADVGGRAVTIHALLCAVCLETIISLVTGDAMASVGGYAQFTWSA